MTDLSSSKIRFDFHSPILPSKSIQIGHIHRIESTHNVSEVLDCIEEVERLTEAGFRAIGFVAYEAAAAFDSSLATHTLRQLPLVWFAIFSQDSMREIETPLDTPTNLPELSWSTGEAAEEYATHFKRIQEAIREGETYQVNYSFRLTSDVGSIPREHLYAHLKYMQQAKYSAWIHTPSWDVISLSPELFFERNRDSITTRPMKGTRPRGDTPNGDVALRRDLRVSAKDRAENLMIVDMLRNDLGKVAVPGSVHVDQLFEIEEYPTVWQMTSTITARLPEEARLADIFSAAFPCGSVTGAPKIKTMEIIKGLEGNPRGVYCGAVGCVLPGRRAVFNVAIRTMTIQESGHAIYNVGSGIVADSDVNEEYQECLDKARVLVAGHA